MQSYKKIPKVHVRLLARVGSLYEKIASKLGKSSFNHILAGCAQWVCIEVWLSVWIIAWLQKLLMMIVDLKLWFCLVELLVYLNCQVRLPNLLMNIHCWPYNRKSCDLEHFDCMF